MRNTDYYNNSRGWNCLLHL